MVDRDQPSHSRQGTGRRYLPQQLTANVSFLDLVASSNKPPESSNSYPMLSQATSRKNYIYSNVEFLNKNSPVVPWNLNGECSKVKRDIAQKETSQYGQFPPHALQLGLYGPPPPAQSLMQYGQGPPPSSQSKTALSTTSDRALAMTSRTHPWQPSSQPALYGIEHPIVAAEQPMTYPSICNTSTGTFAYPPLRETTAGNLRLLRLEVVADINPMCDIYCTLIAAQPWDTGLQYECLSYCWGDSTSTGRLLVRNSEYPGSIYSPIRVGFNLYSALCRLKATHTMKWLWIDAVCIEQANLTERASQVGMMRDIYSRASGVIIWLGESTVDLSAAVTTIASISSGFKTDTSISPESIVTSTGLCLSSGNIERLSTCASVSPGYAYNRVGHFFSLPWFKRVWVLQEAFSHTTITARLGEHTLSWGSIVLAALWQAQFTRTYTAVSSEDLDGIDARHHLPELWLGLLHTRVPRGLPMIELVSRARNFMASDPRDKVFALLGLANDIGDIQTQTPGLRPNYTKHKVDVYSAFAKDLILLTGTLDVLALVNTFIPRAENRSFISWMPDLDVSVATIRGLGFPKKYNASFSTTVSKDIVCAQPDIPRTLTLTGFCFDKVYYVTENAMSFSRDLKVYINDKSDAVMQLWKAYVRFNNQCVPKDDLLQSYVELLTAAGFAMNTKFSAYPLGEVVPSRSVSSLVADFAAYWSRIEPEFSSFDETSTSYLKQLAQAGDADQFGVLAGKACHERKFFFTRSGRFGLCPRDTQIDDAVVILYGGSVPYLLREKELDNWRFVGECYVDGVMFGEAGRMKWPEQTFNLV